jgi:plasmid segregation protein ParM
VLDAHWQIIAVELQFLIKQGIAMNIVGLDIGYSNLKLAYGNSEKGMQTAIRPAGAAPADRFGSRFDGKEQDDFLHVLVGDEPFIAGVSSDRAEMWERSLHSEYARTPSYTALFHAGLLLSGMTEVDVLVTGLPVDQYKDEVRRAELEKQFIGKHKITPKRTVEISKVKVVAQPTGGLFDMISQDDEENPLIDEDARILVVDPGFFSLDWVLISNGQLQRGSSGTSHQASSVLLEQAGILIAEEYGSKPTVETFEKAIRAGKKSLLVMGQRVDIEPYLKRASDLLSANTATSILTSLRVEKMSPDIVVLVGGGADFFRGAVQTAFPKLKVISPQNPVLSIARGYWELGAA